jgi:peptidoglycan DL-endopeptidase CwlO
VAPASAFARFALLAAVLVTALIMNTAPVAAAGSTQAESVIRVGLNQLNDPWKHYAKGPDKFDCVGFVWYAFNQNGLKNKIGGYRSPKGYFNWFKERGRVTTEMSKAKPGDLIVWGRYEHVGIYLGNGRAVSALINPYGVSRHDVKGYLGMRVKGFLRVNFDR